jgi:hypothetical protein
MERKEAMKTIDSLEVSPEKKEWMKTYVDNHLENEKKLPEPENPEPKKEFVHFEIHDAMKDFWKEKMVTHH